MGGARARNPDPSTPSQPAGDRLAQGVLRCAHPTGTTYDSGSAGSTETALVRRSRTGCLVDNGLLLRFRKLVATSNRGVRDPGCSEVRFDPPDGVEHVGLRH